MNAFWHNKERNMQVDLKFGAKMEDSLNLSFLFEIFDFLIPCTVVMVGTQLLKWLLWRLALQILSVLI